MTSYSSRSSEKKHCGVLIEFLTMCHNVDYRLEPALRLGAVKLGN